MSEENKKINVVVWLLVGAILVVGIFLRTYNFHDWLRFNADQGRDAEIVSEVLEGTQAWPLLGPKAGGTTFQLGPVFYYFQIASAKVFGNTPDKMAYPDLLAGILAIPLLFLFLRKYFEVKISFALSVVFALSQFAIRWARFAWNPNSTPFWVLLFLYALHEIIIKKDNRKFLWSLVAGLTVGIGVQLHTMLLLAMPITLFVLGGYLLIKKEKTWRYFLLIFALALVFNIPQMMSECASKGANTAAFFGGITTKEENQHSTVENFVQGNSSVAQIVPNILGGYEVGDNFKLSFDGKHNLDVLISMLGGLLTLSGLVLGIVYFKKEKSEDKKLFLMILAVYVGVLYLLFIKLAFTISVRMYLVLFFVPFFLLGFWLQFLKEKWASAWNFILLATVLLLIFSNLFFVKKYFEEFDGYYKGVGSVDIATLGEMERFSKFIISASAGQGVAYVGGDKKFLFVSSRSISYLIKRAGLDLNMIGSNEIGQAKLAKFFYIVRENKLDNFDNDPNYVVTKQETYGKFSILMLEKK